MITATFHPVPRKSLGICLKTAASQPLPGYQNWLPLTLIFIPALCPFLAACLVPGVERHTEGMFASLQGFQRKERKLLAHPLLSCSVEVLPSDKVAAPWHLGAHFSFPLSCKWWEARQGEQLPGPAPSPGSIMKWCFISASLGLWLSIWDSTWASSDPPLAWLARGTPPRMELGPSDWQSKSGPLGQIISN